MAISPTGPLFPGTAVDSGSGGTTAWTTPANAKVSDGAYATATLGGGGSTNYLQVTSFGFSIPTTAVIDGILVEVQELAPSGHTNTLSAQMLKAGTGSGTAKFDTPGAATWPTSIAWVSYGGATDLWGTTWTPSDINNANFGFQIIAGNTSGGGTVDIDAIRITVYWHVANQNVPKRYIYKVYQNGSYLGNLPTPMSDFTYSQDMNTAGSQIRVEVPISVDTSRQATSVLTDEAGNVLTDESSNTLTTEGVAPIVAPGSQTTSTALIKNGNSLEIWEYGYYWPNGKVVFRGQIQRWEANFGGNGGSDTVKLLAYSSGYDLDNYLVRGNPYTYTGDVTQTSQNSSATVSATSLPSGFNRYGQTWTVGVAVTNLGAISLLLNGTASVTVTVYSSTSSGTVLGTVTQSVSVGAATEIQFAFANPISVTAGSQYFFSVSVPADQSITIYYSNANPYSGGIMWNATYFGGAGGGAWIGQSSSDLYFKTFSGTGSTTGSFTSTDPSTMLTTVLNDYIARGGYISYTSSSVVSTGLSLNYSCNTNTVLEAIKAFKTLAPSTFYWYVDLGTNTLYFQQTATTATYTLTKGRHIDQLTFISSIESLKNTAYFTGGTVSGSNIYVSYSDATSINLYGPRLDRPSDNHVTDTTTARQVAQADVLTSKNEAYQTTVTVLDKTMDISLFRPGQVIGFNGFGSFADSILAQIVRVDYSPHEATLTLGTLPKRLHTTLEQTLRGLASLQTIANPSTPS